MLFSSKQKKIVTILADGQFHSGRNLAEQLGVSRSAICKQIKKLTELGLEITAISGKGYCLQYSLQLLQVKEIKYYLDSTTNSLITELEIHDCINSTNSYLLNKPNQKSKSGIVCFAEYQTAGKGRRGREWVSPFGSNIYLSILWHFQNGPAAIAGLSLVVGVAVIRALHECGINDVGLKWPNDIYWQGKKLAGILIEVSGEASGPCKAVIGLGLNFYIPEKQGESISQDWVDLKQIFSENPSIIRNKLAALLLNHLIPLLADFESNTLQSYLDEWRQYDYLKGNEVTIYMAQQEYTGVFKGIDDNGHLLLSNAQGEIKRFASGEVSFRKS